MLRVAFSEFMGANKSILGFHHSSCTGSCQYKVADGKFQYLVWQVNNVQLQVGLIKTGVLPALLYTSFLA